MSRFTHVFATHSLLQERLATAIVAAAKIAPEEVLLLKVRGSYRFDQTSTFASVDGDRYLHRDGWKLWRHRKHNQAAFAAFEKEVLQQLAPEFEVYSAMYDYWFVRLLGGKAATYHILEDGFGSYRSREEFGVIFARMQATDWRRRIKACRKNLVLAPGQVVPQKDPYDLLRDAGKYYVTSPQCFPFVTPERRVILEHVFPPSHSGIYDGAYLLATSSMVESKLVPMSAYLEMLREVLQKLSLRGVNKLYVKLHPVQAQHPEHAMLYRACFVDAAGLEVIELGQEISVESLAAGNKITLVTGISTLGFHAAALGAEVLTYYADLAAINPGLAPHLGKSGLALFRQISQPL